MTFNEQDVVRDNAGRFDEKPQSTPEVGLSAAWQPGDPVPATISLQRWDDNDDLQHAGETRLDVRAILDMHPRDELENFDNTGNTDLIFEEAVQHGLITHDGPYDVYLDDEVFDSYLAARGEDAVTDRFIDDPARVMQRLRDEGARNLFDGIGATLRDRGFVKIPV